MWCLTGTEMMEITFLDLFYTRLGAVFYVFVWCAERDCFPKVTVISTDARLQPSSFGIMASPLSSLQNAAPYQNIPLWRLHMTADSQQQSVWCLSRCFSPMNTSKLVTGKLSDSWVTVCHSEPTHRWQQLGPQGNDTAGRAVCVGNAELKGSSSRYCQFPRKDTEY